MPVVSSDQVRALRLNIQALFNQGLGAKSARNDAWKKIASIFNSTSSEEYYPWLGQVPSLKEWKDKRQLSGLPAHDYSLVNKDWEATIEVDRNALKDDKLGQIPTRVGQLVDAYYRGIVREVFSRLDAGSTGLAFDGLAFFLASDSRALGESGYIVNIISGSYSGSAAEVRSAISAGAAKMAGFKDENGEYLGLQPDTAVCSPAMLPVIQEAIRPDYAGAKRPEADYVQDIIANPWIDADSLDWYMLCTSEEVKPIIFQNRQNPETTSLDNPDSLANFMEKKLYYGIDARFETGYADPRTAIKVVDS